LEKRRESSGKGVQMNTENKRSGPKPESVFAAAAYKVNLVYAVPFKALSW
jgi:hypothetical protein